MGTDIHLRAEIRRGKSWQKISPPEHIVSDWIKSQIAEYEAAGASPNDPDSMFSYYLRARDEEWYGDRNYRLFAILAGVRNGYGFAGVPIFEPLTPISEPKGLPADYDRTGVANYEEDPDSDGFWYGDHSFSWLTLEELLGYEWEEEVRMVGTFAREDYESEKFQAWDRKSHPPVGYCGDVTGRDVVTILGSPIGAPSNWNFIKIHWTERPAAEDKFYRDVMPALAEAASKEGVTAADIRIVFGFDS